MNSVLMTWNEWRNAYQGETSDGRTIYVDGDVFAEVRADVLKSEIADRTSNWNDLDGDQQHELVGKAINNESPFEGLYDEVDQRLLNPVEWDEQMDGVTIE